jgi:hypothetical protein
MKKLIFGFLGLLLLTSVHAQGSSGEIMGKVLDTVGNEPLYGVKVWVEVGDSKLFGLSNLDGRYRISAVPSGTYTVFLKYKSDTIEVANQYVKPDGFCVLRDITFSAELMMGEAVVEHTREVLINIGNEHMTYLSPKDIAISVNRQNIVDLVANITTDVQKTSGGELIIRGSRPGDVVYFVDGVKTENLGSQPGSSIGGVTIYAGGVPAKYGDTTGGVIILETKSYFDLYRAWKIATSK